jgi:putative methionine-R-sulfoxide reductase with GAF domain
MSTSDADDLLRRAVAELAASEDCSWAGVFFVEGDGLVLGPEAGRADPARRTAVPVTWRGTRIAELAADGEIELARLEEVAAEIADLCLVGWDTGGEAWQP